MELNEDENEIFYLKLTNATLIEILFFKTSELKFVICSYIKHKYDQIYVIL